MLEEKERGNDTGTELGQSWSIAPPDRACCALRRPLQCALPFRDLSVSSQTEKYEIHDTCLPLERSIESYTILRTVRTFAESFHAAPRL